MKRSRKTPLDPRHRELGARMALFAGWEMPIQFSGVVQEHLAVRKGCGLFDVSHMGQIEVEGPGATALLQRLTPNDVERLRPGRAHYSALTNERGGFLDDLVVYRRDEERFLVIANAANTEKDVAWMLARGGPDAPRLIRERSHEFALLALQGPRAEAVLSGFTELDLSSVRYYRFAEGSVAGYPATVARMGYTGEDGFEILLPAEGGADAARQLLAADGVLPAGLGARDSLRLEAKMALHGQDISEDHTVEEADLGWIVKPDKGDFIGRDALVRQRAEGIPRRLVGFELRDRGIPRSEYPVRVAGEPFGEVTSGGFAPFLKKSIGLTYLPPGTDQPGEAFEVLIRGRSVPAEVVETPFYVRPGKRKRLPKKPAAAPPDPA